MVQSEPDSMISRILRKRSSCAAAVNRRPSFREEAGPRDCSIEEDCLERVMVTMAPWGAIFPERERRFDFRSWNYPTNFPTVASIAIKHPVRYGIVTSIIS